MTDRKHPTDDGKRKGARKIPVDKGEPKAAPETDEQAATPRRRTSPSPCRT